MTRQRSTTGKLFATPIPFLDQVLSLDQVLTLQEDLSLDGDRMYGRFLVRL